MSGFLEVKLGAKEQREGHYWAVDVDRIVLVTSTKANDRNSAAQVRWSRWDESHQDVVCVETYDQVMREIAKLKSG